MSNATVREKDVDWSGDNCPNCGVWLSENLKRHVIEQHRWQDMGDLPPREPDQLRYVRNALEDIYRRKRLNPSLDVVQQIEQLVNEEKLALLERIDRPSKKHEYCENDGSCTLLYEIYEVIREERAALSPMIPLGRKDGDE